MTQREKNYCNRLVIHGNGRENVMDNIKRTNNTILSLVSTFYLTICYTKILII
jgi:hypothetical protein